MLLIINNDSSHNNSDIRHDVKSSSASKTSRNSNMIVIAIFPTSACEGGSAEAMYVLQYRDNRVGAPDLSGFWAVWQATPPEVEGFVFIGGI